MCVYASPAFDLLYFLNSSISFDVIEYKRDVLLCEYLDTYNDYEAIELQNRTTHHEGTESYPKAKG